MLRARLLLLAADACDEALLAVGRLRWWVGPTSAVGLRLISAQNRIFDWSYCLAARAFELRPELAREL